MIRAERLRDVWRYVLSPQRLGDDDVIADGYAGLTTARPPIRRYFRW
ncbi:hypothetical protein KCP70_18550 [Salmonella enterica subsp. enterica]|nr:hypothetical protein KCP70_18550 [Salmonella enterica subsp. enterica]